MTQITTPSNLKVSFDWRVLAVLFLVQVAFSGFHTFGKYVLGEVHPLALASLRVTIATPLLLVIAWMADRSLPKLKDMPYLALLGFLGVFVNQLFFILGLNYTTATNAAIFMPSIPVFAAAGAAFFRIEQMTPNRIAGVILAVAGALVMLDFSKVTFGSGPFFGNLLIITNCCSYGLFLVFQRPILKRLGPMTVIAWSFLFGGIGVVTVGWQNLLAVEFSALGTYTLIGLAYIVLIPTTFAYAANTWAVRHSSPTITATFTTFQPVATALLASLFLAESFGARQVGGFVFIVAGLMVVNINSAKVK